MTNHIFRALSHRSFLLLWIGEVFTQLSINLFNFLLILIVFSITKSNTAVSGIVLTYTIPAIIFGIIAGVYVDRWNKKKTLLISNFLRAGLLIVLAAFHTNIYVIFFLSVLISIITQFFIPAESPIIPIIVKKKLLLSANALFGLGIYGSILFAYVLSGPMLIYLGDVNTFVVIAMLLALSGVLISFITLPKSYLLRVSAGSAKRVNNKKVIVQEIREVIGILTKTRQVSHAFVLLALSQILILIIAVLTPGYATQVLGITLKQFPLTFVAPAAIGMLVGAIGINKLISRFSHDKIMTLGLFVSGISMLILPYCSRVASRDFVQVINSHVPHMLSINVLHLMTFLAFFLGLANALVFVPSNTVLQEQTSEESRGKIYGFLSTAIGVFSLLPIIIVGGLSDIIGVGSVLSGIGIFLILLGVVRKNILKI